MPTSSNKGKIYTGYVLNEFSKTYPIGECLDIGCGSGTYPRLYSQLFSNARWTGVEGWGPYIKEHDLHKYYQELICADARWLDYSKLGSFDVSFCGDILEHMTIAEAAKLVDELTLKSKVVAISVPVFHCPQDEVEGNFFEVHVVEDWTMEMLGQIFEHTVGMHQDGYMGVSFVSRYPHVAEVLKAAMSKAQDKLPALESLGQTLPEYFWQDDVTPVELIKKIPTL